MRYANPVLFVAAITAMSYIPSLAWWLIEDVVGIPDVRWFPDPAMDNFGPALFFIMAVIAVPLTETLIFQKLIYFLMSRTRYFRRHRGWIVAVSAVIFGLNHFYSLFYIIWAGLVGALFMWGYIIRLHRGAFWLIAASHALINLLSLLADRIGTG